MPPQHPLDILGRHWPTGPPAPLLLGARDELGAETLVEPLASLWVSVPRQAMVGRHALRGWGFASASVRAIFAWGERKAASVAAITVASTVLMGLGTR